MPEHRLGIVEYWNAKHKRYANTDWIAQPSLFAQFAETYFPRQGHILDLGAGQGQDTRYFAQHGYTVTSLDLSDEAIRIAKEKLADSVKHRVTIVQHDLNDPLPFSDGSFDMVYSSLALHYFTEKITHQIFDEIYRVLKPGGIVACMLNSIHDPEYKTAPAVEPDYFIIDGIHKRYFSDATLLPYVSQFQVITLDENGNAYQQRQGSTNSRFVRFIGKK